MPSNKQKWVQRSKKKGGGGGEEAKRKSQHCCVTFKAKPKFCVQRMPERRGVNIWNRRPLSVRPVNRFVVSFSSLLLLLLYSFSSPSMPGEIFRFGELPVLFFILARNEMQPWWFKMNQNGGDIFSQVQLYPSVLRFGVNYRISRFEQMNWWHCIPNTPYLPWQFFRHFSRFSTS